MKRIAFAALLASLALSPGLVRADDDEGPGKGPEQHEMAPEKLKAKLGLSDDQVEKFKAALKAMREEAKPLREKRRDLMKTLRGQVKDKASDSDIQSTLDGLKDNEKAMRELHQKYMDANAAGLTATQKAKMVLGMAGRMREGGWKGKGRGKGKKEDEGSKESEK